MPVTRSRTFRVLKGLALLAASGALAILVLRLLFPLPPLPGISVSADARPVEDTALGKAILPLAERYPGMSGVTMLTDGRDALAARVLLARTAESTLDVQYYIWQDDTTGWILLDELRAAAERGVRVRLLVDDNGIPGLDAELAGLDALPNAEVRIFNPFTLRSPKLLSYAFDFFRLNRRMHNKSFTADGVATILGGRNVGDIYFAYGEGTHYFDLDVLAAGPAAEEVTVDFEAYWTSDSAYPAELIIPPAPAGLDSLKAKAEAATKSAAATPYTQTIRSSPFVKSLLEGTSRLDWARTTLLSDHPLKGLGQASGDLLLLSQLIGRLGKPERSVDLVSAYFIPGEAGTRELASMAAAGVKTRILTNALEATDVPPVHSAYVRYRPTLVDAGVEMLELRAHQNIPREFELAHMIIGSTSSLHSKTISIDRERIFIGSFNFDPRSAALNTEMGLLIESPVLADSFSTLLDRTATSASYRLRRNAAGALEWVETRADGSQTLHTLEPKTTLPLRAYVTFLSWLPIEWML
jgi:putative cardiolipin synthase